MPTYFTRSSSRSELLRCSAISHPRIDPSAIILPSPSSPHGKPCTAPSDSPAQAAARDTAASCAHGALPAPRGIVHAPSSQRRTDARLAHPSVCPANRGHTHELLRCPAQRQRCAVGICHAALPVRGIHGQCRGAWKRLALCAGPLIRKRKVRVSVAQVNAAAILDRVSAHLPDAHRWGMPDYLGRRRIVLFDKLNRPVEQTPGASMIDVLLRSLGSRPPDDSKWINELNV